MKTKQQIRIEKKTKSSLSNRELEVLKLLALGMKNTEISEFLNISNKTVGTYLTRLKSKLKSPSRENTFLTVAKAINLGFLEYNFKKLEISKYPNDLI